MGEILSEFSGNTEIPNAVGGLEEHGVTPLHSSFGESTRPLQRLQAHLLPVSAVHHMGPTNEIIRRIAIQTRNVGHEVGWGIHMSAHSGTHVDTPAHFMSDVSGLDGYAPNDFIRRAHVVNCGDREEVGLEALQGPGGFSELTVERGDAVLFKTANSVRDLCVAGEFTEDFTHLSGDAAALCVRMGVGLVGLDYITIDPYESEDYPAHTTLMKGGVLILEG